MKRNVGFIVGVILLMVVVWALTVLGRNIFFNKEKGQTHVPTLAIEKILC